MAEQQLVKQKTSVYVLIKAKSGEVEAVARDLKVQEFVEKQKVFIITGFYDIVCHVNVDPSNFQKSLGDIIFKIHLIPGVTDTYTVIPLQTEALVRPVNDEATRMRFYIFAKVETGRLKDFAERLMQKGEDGIVTATACAGTFDAVVELLVPNMDTYRHIVLNVIQADRSVRTTESMLALEI